MCESGSTLQKRWKALKSAESPLSLNPIGSSIFPTVSVLDVVSSNDDIVLPPVRIAQVKKLKVYTGADHPHAAQNPQPYEISQVAQ